MKKIISAAACGLLLAAVPAIAQSPRAPRRPVDAPSKTKTVEEKKAGADLDDMSMSAMTPEMWIYMQEVRRHDDPKLAVRRKAEYRAAQRARRMASRAWFGYSNSRPYVNPDPWTAGYSAHWSANNAMRPDQWIGNGRTAAYRR